MLNNHKAIKRVAKLYNKISYANTIRINDHLLEKKEWQLGKYLPLSAAP